MGVWGNGATSAARMYTSGAAALCLALCLTVLLPAGARAVTFTFDATGDPEICNRAQDAWKATDDSADANEFFPTVTDDTENRDECVTGLIDLTFRGYVDYTGQTIAGLDLSIQAHVLRPGDDGPGPLHQFSPDLAFDENGIGVSSSGIKGSTGTDVDTSGGGVGPRVPTFGSDAVRYEGLALNFNRDVLLTGVKLWTNQNGTHGTFGISTAGTTNKTYQLMGPEGETTGERIVTIETTEQETWRENNLFLLFGGGTVGDPQDPNLGWRLQGFSFQILPLLPPPDTPSFGFDREGFNTMIDAGDCISDGALLTHYFTQIGRANTDRCRNGGTGLGWQFKLDPAPASRPGYDLSLVVTGGWDAHEGTGGGARFVLNNLNQPFRDRLKVRADPLIDGMTGRGLGVRSYSPGDNFNIAMHVYRYLNTNHNHREFLELNFEEFMTGEAMETFSGEASNAEGEATVPLNLERIRLTALDIWTQLATPQSFEVEAVGSDSLVQRRRDTERDRLELSTDASEQCAGGGYCQTFVTDLLSDAGRFFIWGTQSTGNDGSNNITNPNVGIRLRGFSFRLEPIIPSLLPAPEPVEAMQDLNPFRFNTENFNAFIDADDCIADKEHITLAPHDYVQTRDLCKLNSDGRGGAWLFELPSEAAREERVVNAETGDTTTTAYGLRLTVTGALGIIDSVNIGHDGLFETDITLNPSDSIRGNLQYLEVDDADGGRGLGLYFTHDNYFSGLHPDDSPNMVTRIHPNCTIDENGEVIPGEVHERFKNLPCDDEGKQVRYTEFLELNFSEYEIESTVLTASGITPIETASLERIELTAVEIWTQTNAPQKFQVRALAHETPTANRLFDPLVSQVDLVTDNAQQCAPLAGSAGTHTGGGYCQSFELSLTSHVGRFLIIGTQLAEWTGDTESGIRLRSFSYEYQTAAAQPEVTRLANPFFFGFVFSAQQFDSRIVAGDCIIGKTLTTRYDISADQQCQGSNEETGVATGRGWEFELPSEAQREDRIVNAETDQVTTIRYGLRLTITGNIADPANPTREIAPGTPPSALEADGAGPDDGRGLGVRSQGFSYIGPGPGGTFIRFDHSPNIATLPSSPGTVFQEFLELNFSEYEIRRSVFTDAGITPIETDSLEAVELTGIEIWTATQTPQTFQVRALRDETPRANRLNDPVISQMDLITNNAQPCAPLDGSDGTSAGYCQSFSFLNTQLFSRVGRFLIVGTQLAESNHASLTMTGIRLRSIRYRYQAVIPLPGALILGLTGLAGLGAVAARRRLRRAA